MINWFKKYLEKRKQEKSLEELSKKIYSDNSSIIEADTLTEAENVVNSIEAEKSGIKKLFSKKRKSDAKQLEELNANMGANMDDMLRRLK